MLVAFFRTGAAWAWSIDNDYKAATKNIPNQKPKESLGRHSADTDRQEPITPYHRDSFNGH
jgi:hypothetical protein